MTVVSALAGVILCLTSFLTLPAFAQDVVTAPVPDSLRRGASVVKRIEQTEIEIESTRKAKVRRRVVYTILNAAGDIYATFYTFYDKFHDLVNVTGTLYDAGGRTLKSMRKSEMEDWSTAGSGILMTDSRVKLYHFDHRGYPYSVAFEEEVEQSGLFVLPEWRPQPSPSMAVENSSLVIRTPAGYPLRFKQSGDATATEEENAKGRVYTWVVRDRRAINREPLAPAWSGAEPRVMLASGEFSEGPYKGRLDSWADLGRFVEDLYRGRDNLPEEAKRKLHVLVDSVTDDRRKIDILYEWMQKDMHYVAIELGIGGWQPFDVKDVFTKKYGDCKALANYMVALLKEAGIRAYNVLVRSGDHPPAMDTGFVCSQFDHVIVVALAGKDSVWLECTSSYLPAGYLSGFTADRDALLLDNNGGHIVHTPAYGVNENRVSRLLRGRLDSGGNLQAQLQDSYSGLEQDALESELDHLQARDFQDQRQQALGLANFTIDGLNYRTSRAAVPKIEETMRLTDAGFSTVSGSRIFVNPAAFLRRTESIREIATRRMAIELTQSCEETDSILLKIPSGYAPEGALPSASYSSSFGSYRINGVMKGDTLILISRFRQIKGIYPAGSWSAFEHFFNLVRREGDRELVFIRAIKPG